MPRTSTDYYVAQPVLPRRRRRDACEQASPEAAKVLAVVRRTQDEVRAGEAKILDQAVEWARLHEVTDPDEAATWGDTPIPIAGEGAPLVSEFCLAEFAAALGMKPEAGRYFIAHALELAHRLPHLYARVMVGAVPVWRARRIAEKTLDLSLEAAAYLDAEIAPVADKIGPVVTERLVDEAISRFMPEHAAELAEQAEEKRHVTVDKRQVGFHGTFRIHGELDIADALDLDAALARGAEYLKEQGSTDPLDIRRAQALGNLARSQNTGESSGSDLTLYVHMVSTGSTGELEPHATVENAGTHLVALEQIQKWCATAGTVNIKPVIDLAKTITSIGYQPSESLREHVVLRDRICAHPYCTRPARSADLDHIEPHDEGGTTTSENLAPLCRFHHRLKTHGGWTYIMIRPGTYLWRSPYGYQYLRDANGGTTDLTPRPVDPPGS